MAKEEILTIEDVLDKARRYLTEEDVTFLRRAYDYAETAHKDQYRKSGESYIVQVGS